jgi:hypothetical protein
MEEQTETHNGELFVELISFDQMELSIRLKNNSEPKRISSFRASAIQP